MRPNSTITGFTTRVLAGLILCGSASALFAGDPPPSREYPQTYTERVTPWYDPSGIMRRIGDAFTKDDPPAQAPKSEKLPITVATPVNVSRLSEQPPKMPSPGAHLLNVPQAAPTPVAVVDGLLPRAMDSGSPAWKWYGYGTVTPNQNPHAPQGNYRPVPVEWHGQTGTTPGAIPTSPVIVNSKPTVEAPPALPKPVVQMPTPVGQAPINPIPAAVKTDTASTIVMPKMAAPPSVDETPAEKADDNRLPAVLVPPSIVPAQPVSNEKSPDGPSLLIMPAPASLKAPVSVKEETVTTEPVEQTIPGSSARLRPPVRSEVSENPPGSVQSAPVPVPQAVMPSLPAPTPVAPSSPTPMVKPVERPDGAALPNENTDSPDIPVEAAPGIVIPGAPGSMSRHRQLPYIARGKSEQPLESVIRKATGDLLREVRWDSPSTVTIVLKSGNIDSAWQARERLAQVPELRRVTVHFEITHR